jgi:hypothetical protein
MTTPCPIPDNGGEKILINKKTRNYTVIFVHPTDVVTLPKGWVESGRHRIDLYREGFTLTPAENIGLLVNNLPLFRRMRSGVIV